MARTQRNFFYADCDDEWNDGKSVRKHVNKSKRLKIKQNLRDFDFNDVELMDSLETAC
jgi:hypothetical protein